MEHNDYTGFEFEPSGRLQWNFLDHQMLWTAVSRAVRTPSRYDRDLYEPAPPGVELVNGNNSFKSETVIAYELGYRAQFLSRVAGSISVFYNDYDRVRSLGLTDPTLLPFYFENNLVAQTYGFEFSGDYQAASWWRWHASYDLLKEDIHNRSGVNVFTADLFHAHNETADPQQQFQIRSSMDITRDIDFDLALRWVDQIQAQQWKPFTIAEVPSYFELNARLAWRPLKNLEIAVVGQNLLHNHHVEYGFPSPTQEAIERSVYGKVSFFW